MQRLTNSSVALIRAKILAAQAGLCAICKIAVLKEAKIPTLDHDHMTGVCRGVLCNNCNGLEGKVNNIATRAKRDGTTLQWLKSLVVYLEFHLKPQTAYLHPTHKSADEKRILINKRARLKRAAAMKAKVVSKLKVSNE